MAKDSSFDIVSQVDMQEVDNAYQQTARELTQRYDLKNSGATIDLAKSEGTITVVAPADFVARQVIDVLGGRLVKRGIDLKAVQWDAPQAASGGSVRVVGRIVTGIDKETAKRIAAGLAELGVSQLSAILITHEHTDHIGGLATYIKKYHTPIFCTSDVSRQLACRLAGYVGGAEDGGYVGGAEDGGVI